MSHRDGDDWLVNAIAMPRFNPQKDRILYLPGNVGFSGPGGFNFQSNQWPVGSVIRPNPDLFESMECPSSELGSALREWPPRPDVWRKMTLEISRMVGRAVEGLGGTLHVFAQGPHALGAFLGAELGRLGKSIPVAIYNVLNRRDQPVEWHCYGALVADLHGSVKLEYLRELELDEEEPLAGCARGIIVSIDFPHRAKPQALLQVEGDLGIQSHFRIRLQRQHGKFITSRSMAEAVVNEICAQLESLRKAKPDVPIHVLTSAPLPILIALGRWARPTVAHGLIIHHYDPGTSRYVPVLDIRSNELAARPASLRVRQGMDGYGYVFELNGNVLPLVRALDMEAPAGSRPGEWGASEVAERRSDSLPSLHAWALRRKVWTFPLALEEVLAERGLLTPKAQVDVDVELEGDESDLSWEFLYLQDRTSFAALRQGWSIGRKIPSAPAYSRPKALPQALRVHLICALDQGEPAYELLDLDDLWRELEDIPNLEISGDWATDLQTLARSIEAARPHVVHWIGHGRTDSPWGLRDVLQIHEEGGSLGLSRSRFRNLFLDLGDAMPALTILSACNVGDTTEQGYGIPGTLIREGFGAVVAFRDSVDVGAIRTFSQGLYPALAQGLEIRGALQRARAHMHEAGKSPYSTGKFRGKIRPSDFGAPVLIFGDRSALGPIVSTVAERELSQSDAQNREVRGMESSNDEIENPGENEGPEMSGRGDLDGSKGFQGTMTPPTPAGEVPRDTEAQGEGEHETLGEGDNDSTPPPPERRADGKGVTRFGPPKKKRRGGGGPRSGELPPSTPWSPTLTPPTPVDITDPEEMEGANGGGDEEEEGDTPDSERQGERE